MAELISKDQIEAFAADVLEEIKKKHGKSGAALLLLSGELGAGKTTFVQALARILGVQERVTSPTFLLQKEFQTTDKRFKRLVHIDAYRLESFEELEKLGWEKFREDAHTLIVLEWPERVEERRVFDHAFRLTLEHVNESTRSTSLSYPDG